MKVSYELTMPNVGSWNGKWTGADKKYYVIRTYFGEEAKKIKELVLTEKSWYYNFGDGWGASVSAEIVTASEANKRIRNSKGFSGYEWMIGEIQEHGRILERAERQQIRANA